MSNQVACLFHQDKVWYVILNTYLTLLQARCQNNMQASSCLCCLCYWFCICSLDIHHPEDVQIFWELHVLSVCQTSQRLSNKDETGSANKGKLVRHNGLVVWEFKETVMDTPFRAKTAPANVFSICLQHSPFNMVNNVTCKVKSVIISCSNTAGLYWGIHKSSEEMNTCPNVLNAGRRKPPHNHGAQRNAV